MSERTMEKARQVVHRLSEWYFAEGGDNDPDSPIDREDLDALHELVRTAEATAEMERRQAGAYADVAAVVRRELEAPGAGEDVRERVAREVFTLDADWRREYWDQFRRDFPRQAQAYYDTADRILCLLRTPRGEGEAAAMSASLSRALAAMQAAWIEWRRGRGADAAMEWIENTLIGPGAIPGDDESDAQAFFDRAIAEIEHHQIRHAAALRSDAPVEGEADALELIRWAETRGAVLEPVAGNVMPPGTYACYVEGVGDDPAEYEDAGEPYMGPGILGAIRAARRGEGGGA